MSLSVEIALAFESCLSASGVHQHEKYIIVTWEDFPNKSSSKS